VNGATKLEIYSYLDIGKYLRVFQNFYVRGSLESVGPPNVNLAPPNISESKRARKLKLKTPLDIVTYSPRVQTNSARGRRGGAGPPNVNLVPLKSQKLLELEC